MSNVRSDGQRPEWCTKLQWKEGRNERREVKTIYDCGSCKQTGLAMRGIELAQLSVSSVFSYKKLQLPKWTHRQQVLSRSTGELQV